MKNLFSLLCLTVLSYGSIAQCAGYTLNVTFNNPTCFQFSDGSINVSTSGGNGGDVFQIYDDMGNLMNFGGSANNLIEGWYYIVVTDALGCVLEDSVFIDGPNQLDIGMTINNPLCFGDSTGIAQVDTVYNAQGNYSNISYFWNPNPSGVGGIGATTSTDLYAATYTLTINDEYGCSDAIDFSITTPSELIFTELGADPAYCRIFGYQSGNGVIYAAAGGGTPDYSYTITNDQTGTSLWGTTWGGLNPGNYTVEVIDNNGCILTETIFLDSVNPQAGFDVTSAQLDWQLFGYPPVYATFTNTSTGFANPNNPTADTTFFWNYGFTGEPWKIITSYDALGDTTYTANGYYPASLIATNKNGCADTLVRWIYVGLLDINEENQINYSLITGTDEITLLIQESAIPISAKVFSINGQLIREEDLHSGTNQIPLEPAIYLLQFINRSTGEVLMNEKILVGG